MYGLGIQNPVRRVGERLGVPRGASRGDILRDSELDVVTRSASRLFQSTTPYQPRGAVGFSIAAGVACPAAWTWRRVQTGESRRTRMGMTNGSVEHATGVEIRAENV